MLTSLENGLGLDIVLWLQEHGSGLLDGLARLLDFTGGSMFILVAGPLIYWSLHKRTGQHMILLIVIGALAFTVTKQLADTPRPFVAHPEQVDELFEEEGGGMPSGHMVNTLTFWLPGVLVLQQRHKWRWWALMAALLLSMAWGRMYAGVHYPQDVLGGLLLGGILIWAYYRARLEPPTALTPPRLVALSVLALVLIPFFGSYDDGLVTIGVFLGAIWGMWIETHYVQRSFDTDRSRRILRYLAGVVVTLAIFLGLRVVFGSADPAALLRVVRYGAVMLFVVAVWPWLWPKIGL